MKLNEIEKELIREHRERTRNNLTEFLSNDEMKILDLYRESDKVEFTKHAGSKDNAMNFVDLLDGDIDNNDLWLKATSGKIEVTGFYS